MTSRIVTVVLRGDVSHLVAQAKAGAAAVTSAADKMTGATKEGEQFRRGLTTIGDTAGKIGLAATAGLGLAAKAAIDWESAWAGVEKTVDGNAEQMGRLEGQLRGLARELPATHTEIAAVAEAAGQLGVARDDIASFTRTMIDLGETTNLTSDEAATAIAQMQNVMQTAPADVDNLASTLVALGNAGASTEADILAMAQRLTGAGQLIGASEADVLALASSMADLGIQSELGGGAMSRVLQKIYTDVTAGGDALDGWAVMAGQSAQQFADTWERDPVRALDAVIGGLNETKENGGDVIQALDLLGIKGTQNLQVMLRMAGAQDGLSNALDLSASSWQENTALADEAAKRYETTASQVQVAWNNIKDAAIEAGAVLLPVIADVAGGIGSMAQAFGDLPGPVQTGMSALLGITAVTGGSAWFGAKVISGITSARTAFSDLGITVEGTKKQLSNFGTTAANQIRGVSAEFEAMSSKQVALRGGAAMLGTLALAFNDLDSSADDATRTIGAFASIGGGALLGFAVGGPIGAAIGGGASAIYTLVDAMGESDSAAREAAAGAEVYRATLDEVTGATTEATAAMVAQRLEQQGVLEAAQSLGINTQTLVDGILGQEEAAKSVSQTLADLKGQYEGAGQALDAFNSGWDLSGSDGPVDMEALRRAAEAQEAYQELGPAVETVARAFGIESDAIEQSGAAREREAQATGEATSKTQENTAATQGNAESQRDLAQALVDARNARIRNQSAIINWNQSIADANKAAKDNGRNLDITTEKGRANRQALLNLAGAWNAQSVAVRNNRANQRQAIETFVQVATRMGMNEKKAREYAKSLYAIPERRDTKLNVNLGNSLTLTRQLAAEIDKVKSKTVTISVRRIGGNAPMLDSPREEAAGGYIAGPGTATSDSIPAMLSNGEYVVRAAAVDHYGVATFDRLNAMRFAGGGLATLGDQMAAQRTQFSQTVHHVSSGPSTAVLNGPVAIRGRVNVDTGELIGVLEGPMTAIAERVVDANDAYAAGRARMGVRR